MNIVDIPKQSTPVMDRDSATLMSKPWWVALKSVVSAIIAGLGSLQHVGVIPKITGPGALGESVITDTGTQVDIEELVQPYGIKFSVKAGAVSLLQTGTAPQFPFIEYLDNTGTRGAYVGWGSATVFGIYLENSRNLVVDGGKAGFGGNTTPSESVDVAGNVNVSGVYKVATVPGITITQAVGTSLSVGTILLQYKDWGGSNVSATVVTSVGITTSNQVFRGGIRTA